MVSYTVRRRKPFFRALGDGVVVLILDAEVKFLGDECRGDVILL